MRRLRAAAAAAAVALLVALSAGGCTNAGGVIRETPSPGDTTTTTPSLSSASPTSTTEEQRILAQYRAFFAALTPTSEAPASQRRQMLEPYATDPVLTRTLSGMRASDRLGQVGYGEILTRPRITRVDKGVAVVRDCQDASRHGRKDRDTGRITTKGCRSAAGSARWGLRGWGSAWRWTCRAPFLGGAPGATRSYPLHERAGTDPTGREK
jgi:hypothetical protein